MKRVMILIEDERVLENMRALREHLLAEGLKVQVICGIDSVYHASGAEGEIWISDSATGVHALRKLEIPVVAYLHPWNRDADFAGVLYAAEQLEELSGDYFDKVYRRYKKIPWEILKTPRCLVRETVPEDAEAFARIYSEPEITRYTDGFCREAAGSSRKEDTSGRVEGTYHVKAEKDYIRQYIERIYEFYGYGIWTVVLKDTGEVVGRVGFQNFAEQSDGNGYPELGYMIATAYQGKGLAQEVCRAVLEYAREELFFEGVRVVIREENQVSIRLAQKLGFCHTGNFENEKGKFFRGERLL